MRRRNRHLGDLDADIRHHIERETQDNIDRGMPPEDARREAFRKFGNVALVKQDTRAVWSVVWLEQLLQDTRYALRALLRNPGFTAVVVLTLALGIGMNTAVFSVFNAVLLRPLPYPDPGRLLWVTTHEKEWNEEFVDDADFREWRKQAASFEQFVAYETRDTTIKSSDDVIRTRIAMVSEDFWRLSGVAPALGRMPQHGERELLLTHRFFERWLGNDPGIVGKPVLIGEEQVVVAGVLPETAEFPMPRPTFTHLDTNDIAGYASVPDEGFASLNGVIAKLKPNVTIDAGRAELEVIRARKEDRGRWDYTDLRVIPLQDKIVGQARRALWILLAAVAFVLLITCANVANLLLARASARQREIAVRASVGAGRARVFRQFLVESTLLAFLGGAAGLLVAHWGIRTVVRLAPDAIPRLGQATIFGNVLVFAACASILTAFLFGFAPGISLWKLNLYDVLKDSARASSATPASIRFRRLLVAAELALAAVLLTGAGLMVKSFWVMYSLPPGFHPERILMMKVSVTGPEYFGNAARQAAYVDEGLRRVRAVPGVEAASILFRGPAEPQWEGAPPPPPGEEAPLMVATATSADYARAMGLRLVKGRWFTDSEPEPVIVINESLARRDFFGQDPMGKRLKGVGPVVGIVADLKFSRLDANPEPEFFVPYMAMSRRGLGRGELQGTIIVQTKGDAMAGAAAIQKSMIEVDKTQAVYDVKTVERALADSITPRRFNLFLLVSFAAAALSLALVGIYGVTAYSVAQRTNEIGVRMALGAQRREVVSMVLRQGLAMALAGIGAGLAAALALTRVMASLLYDVEPTDPQTFIVAGVALVITAVAACWLPALKAALVDPIVALRYE